MSPSGWCVRPRFPPFAMLLPCAANGPSIDGARTDGLHNVMLVAGTPHRMTSRGTEVHGL